MYADIKQRLELDDETFDQLSNYLCTNYSEYLCNSKEMYGSMQRKEDAISFAIYKYKEYLESHVKLS